jgi:hypothetical protein
MDTPETDIGTPEAIMRHALAGKERRRHELAALPYEEKLRMLLRMQRMADAIRQTRGGAPRAWPIDEETLLPIPPTEAKPH